MTISDELFRDFARLLFEQPNDGDLDEWLSDTLDLLADTDHERSTLLGVAEAHRWAREFGEADDSLPGPAPSDGASDGLLHELSELQGPRSLRQLRRHSVESGGEGEPRARAFLRRAFRRDRRLSRLADADTDAFVSSLFDETRELVAALESLRDPSTPVARRLREVFPPLAALAEPAPAHASWEHDDPLDSERPTPLLDHLAERTLRRKLAGLEAGNRDRFQRDSALSRDAFREEVDRVAAVREKNLLPVVRAALLFLDFSKGGSSSRRDAWRRRFDVDLAVHNVASARIVEQRKLLDKIPQLRNSTPLRALVRTLIAHHGLVGQAVRGETPLSMFDGLVETLRSHSDGLAAEFDTTPEAAIEWAVECLHVIDICDTAAVREVREQYGVLRYDAYREAIMEWLGDESPPPNWIELPEDIRSYLQDGYPRHLRPKVRLFDGSEEPVEFPDSNCLMVIQKG